MENYFENSRTMNKRVIASVAYSVINANFNADFNGLPRQTPDGKYFATNVSVAHACRSYWYKTNKLIFSYKSFKVKEVDGELEIVPKMQVEQYNDLFPYDGKKTTNYKAIKNLYTVLDIRNFGVCCTIPGGSIGIPGVAQITMPINKNPETTTTVLQILSPFLNKETDKSTPVGSKAIVDEAHYFYNLTVNPTNVKQYEEYIVPYTEADYLLLKQAVMKGITFNDSGTKAGCCNEFGVFVTFKEDNNKTIEDISSTVRFEFRADEKNIIDLSLLTEKVEEYKEYIEDVEIIYDKNKIELINYPEIARIFDISAI